MLIVKSGKVLAAGDEWDAIEEYAAKHKTKVAKVFLLPVVGSMVKLWVYWKDGALGTFDGDNHTTLADYVRALKGWPKPEEPRMMSGPLPFIIPMPDEVTKPALAPEPVEVVVEDAPVRIRRQRRK
jgi:hypothetical protein